MRILSTDPRHPGFFAIGQEAVGVIAFGQLALGVVAIGQLARGVFAVGQLAVGVFAAGQGAVGLWHGSGMVAIAGQRGYGFALHLLPRIVTEPRSDVPNAESASEVLSGAAKSAWIPAKLYIPPHKPPASPGASVIPDEALNVELDVSAVKPVLAAGIGTSDRVMLRVRAERTAEVGGYREAHTETKLVAEEAIVFSSRPRWHLAYGQPPAGTPGTSPASGVELVARTFGWLVAFGIVAVATFLPLAQALLWDD
jgi:hypothetical protein